MVGLLKITIGLLLLSSGAILYLGCELAPYRAPLAVNDRFPNEGHYWFDADHFVFAVLRNDDKGAYSTKYVGGIAQDRTGPFESEWMTPNGGLVKLGLLNRIEYYPSGNRDPSWDGKEKFFYQAVFSERYVPGGDPRLQKSNRQVAIVEFDIDELDYSRVQQSEIAKDTNSYDVMSSPFIRSGIETFDTREMDLNSMLESISFEVGHTDPAVELSELSISVTSGNPEVIPVENITVESLGDGRFTMDVRSGLRDGVCRIRITVSDSRGNKSETVFPIRVRSVSVN